MNLNIFKRISALEEEQKQMSMILLEAVKTIRQLQDAVNHNTMDALNAALQKKREYARKYYAKKKAERAA